MMRNILVGRTWPELGLFAAAMWWLVRPFGRRLALRVEARTPIADTDRRVLAQAFQVLGKERVALGLKATGHMWGECFLSYAQSGAPFGFRPALERGWRNRPTPHLTIDQTNTIVRVWDRKEAAFRTFAGEWLGVRHQVGAPDTRVSSSLHEGLRSVSVDHLVMGGR